MDPLGLVLKLTCLCVCVCEKESVCLYVRACERERKSVSFCVCVRERERERERDSARATYLLNEGPYLAHNSMVFVTKQQLNLIIPRFIKYWITQKKGKKQYWLNLEQAFQLQKGFLFVNSRWGLKSVNEKLARVHFFWTFRHFNLNFSKESLDF